MVFVLLYAVKRTMRFLFDNKTNLPKSDNTIMKINKRKLKEILQ